MELESLLIKRGESDLSANRWEHCLRTADYVVFLAEQYSVKSEILRLASLAHDLAREWDAVRINEAALKDQKTLSLFNSEHPVLLHGFAAAWLLQEEYSVTDQSLLNAVRYHTTGHPVLDDAGLILFSADYMEPGRSHLDDSTRKSLLELPLEEMVLSILDAMAEHLNTMGSLLSPDSRELYEKLMKGYNKPS
jgi:predicted HD superfamily hydrolase involved in NAD metabolism